MELKRQKKIRPIGGSFAVIIPKDMCNFLKFTPDSVLTLEADENSLIIKVCKGKKRG